MAHTIPISTNDATIGDQYTFIALERNSKFIVAWHVGRRTSENTQAFVNKIRWATTEDRFQINTDAFPPYVAAIGGSLGDRVDYSKVVKVYSASDEEGRARYSPGDFVAIEKSVVMGNPDMARACTSHVERVNGTVRQWCKRLTRLTYAFSKKLENLKSALARHFRHYN